MPDDPNPPSTNPFALLVPLSILQRPSRPYLSRAASYTTITPAQICLFPLIPRSSISIYSSSRSVPPCDVIRLLIVRLIIYARLVPLEGSL